MFIFMFFFIYISIYFTFLRGVDHPITLHHWNMLMQANVLEHSLSRFEWFSFPSTPSTLAAKIYILSHRDKNSVNISLRTSGSALSSPALSWLCGGWRALIVTTAARSSRKQPLNCHQTEFWMSVLFFPLFFFLSFKKIIKKKEIGLAWRHQARHLFSLLSKKFWRKGEEKKAETLWE